MIKLGAEGGFYGRNNMRTAGLARFQRFALVWVGLLLSLSCAAGIPPEAVQWKEKGLEMGKSKPNSDEEARCYEKAVELAPEYTDAWFNLGQVRQAQGSYARAVEAYQQVIQLKPDDAEALYNLGSSLAEMPGKTYDARKYLARVAKISEKDGDPDLRAKARKAVYALEQTIAQSIGEVTVMEAITPEKVVNQLNQGLKRGQSPYLGPRLPVAIQFAYNSAKIEEPSKPLLKNIAQGLKDPKLRGMVVRIEGHADSQGDSEYNQKLSLRRAESVKQSLRENLGVKEITLECLGCGEDRPLVPNDSSEHQAKNRRVEFVNQSEHQRMKAELSKNSTRGAAADVFEQLYY